MTKQTLCSDLSDRPQNGNWSTSSTIPETKESVGLFYQSRKRESVEEVFPANTPPTLCSDLFEQSLKKGIARPLRPIPNMGIGRRGPSGKQPSPTNPETRIGRPLRPIPKKGIGRRGLSSKQPSPTNPEQKGNWSKRSTNPEPGNWSKRSTDPKQGNWSKTQELQSSVKIPSTKRYTA
jgi:hypothetical protein